MCHEMHSAITSKCWELQRTRVVLHGTDSLGFGGYFVIICCWSQECIFHVFLPFYPECNFAWGDHLRIMALWEMCVQFSL